MCVRSEIVFDAGGGCHGGLVRDYESHACKQASNQGGKIWGPGARQRQAGVVSFMEAKQQGERERSAEPIQKTRTRSGRVESIRERKAGTLRIYSNSFFFWLGRFCCHKMSNNDRGNPGDGGVELTKPACTLPARRET